MSTDNQSVSEPQLIAAAEAIDGPSSSPIKTKRTRKISDKASPQTKIANQTRIYTKTKSQKSSPWKKVNKAATFDTIMNEQRSAQQPQIDYLQSEMDEQALLEQQLILQAIEESKKSQQQQQTQQIAKDDEKMQEINTKIENDKTKDVQQDTPKAINDELIAAEINAQTMAPIQDNTISDEKLAIELQRQEQLDLIRRQKLSERFDGKHSKLKTYDVEPTAIPKSALNFYYNDESLLNGGLTTEQYQQKLLEAQQSSEEQIVDKKKSGKPYLKKVRMSKHDTKMWSQKHVERLNEYEAAGNLDSDLNIGNRAFNSFKNKLDAKGYANFHDYRLEPKSKKK